MTATMDSDASITRWIIVIRSREAPTAVGFVFRTGAEKGILHGGTWGLCTQWKRLQGQRTCLDNYMYEAISDLKEPKGMDTKNTKP